MSEKVRFSGISKSGIIEKINVSKVFGINPKITEDYGDELCVFHNSSPTIEDMLGVADEIGEENITYEGYQIFPPNEDWGLYLTGFTVRFEHSERAKTICGVFGEQAQSGVQSVGDGWLRFWWN